MSGKVWLVVGREYKEQVGKKSFWIGLLLGPLLIGGVIALQVLSYTVAPDVQKPLVIVDRSGQISEAVTGGLAAAKLKSGEPEFIVRTTTPAADSTVQFTELSRQVAAKELYGYLLVGEDPEATNAFRFFTRNVGNSQATDKIEEAANEALVGYRLGSRNLALTREELESITKRARLETFKVSKEGEATKRDFGGTYVATIAFAVILLMTILGYGVIALRGILEEKSSRIIEVLLSSITPFDLMMGKIVGICLVGLTQVAAYAASGAALSLYGLASPSTGLLNDVMASFSPAMMGFFLLYYLLGFFLFLSMFAAVGAMVNSEQEAQHMQQPLLWALIIPMYATFFFVNSPDSTLARVVSFIPFFTPMVMLTRISVLTPPWWEIALSIVLMLVTIAGVVWVVSRIFRVGILMYGKRPNLPEIVRWVKTG